MKALALTAHNVAEKRIKEYLERNASDTLAYKINNGTPTTKDGKQLIMRKTLQGFFKWATTEARKLAEKGANFACVDDQTVFGWAIHYFEEEAIGGELFNQDGTPYQAPKPEPKAPTKPTQKTEAPKTEQVQMRILDIPAPDPEPKKATIIPMPTPKPEQKPTKKKATDTDQISLFDLF
jgi:hypothetical protein